MRAIILSAGIGRRLKPLTDIIPKALLRVDGKTVLEQMLDSLLKNKVRDICIIIGYLGDKIESVIGRTYGKANITYLENRYYHKGSILSVWAARGYFDDDMLLMDADVVFEEGILRRLISSQNQNCFLLDADYKDSGEEMKIAALNGKVAQIARRITVPHDKVGEGIGFFKLSKRYRKEFLRILENRIASDKDCDYEDALDEFVRVSPVGFEEITGMKWTEIDFREDIAKARSLNP